MSTYQSPTDHKLAALMGHYRITGTVTEGGPTSRVYDVQNRVFSVEIACEGLHDCFAVYVGEAHPDIDPGFALGGFSIQPRKRRKRPMNDGWPRAEPSTKANSAMRQLMPSTRRATRLVANSGSCSESRSTSLFVRPYGSALSHWQALTGAIPEG
jgi:hypothetical protein